MSDVRCAAAGGWAVNYLTATLDDGEHIVIREEALGGEDVAASYDPEAIDAAWRLLSGRCRRDLDFVVLEPQPKPAPCRVCGGYGQVRAECGPPYFMIPCWGCKSGRT